VEKVLLSISEVDITPLLSGLNLDACDVLMKYLYKIMGKFNNSSLMLKIHAQLIEKAGIGSIIRVLTDRKQV
jgi:actin related protein 2/3 complex subunit 5